MLLNQQISFYIIVFDDRECPQLKKFITDERIWKKLRKEREVKINKNFISIKLKIFNDDHSVEIKEIINIYVKISMMISSSKRNADFMSIRRKFTKFTRNLFIRSLYSGLCLYVNHYSWYSWHEKLFLFMSPRKSCYAHTTPIS